MSDTEELVCVNCLARVTSTTKPCPRCQGTTFVSSDLAPLFEDYQTDADYQSNAAGRPPEPEGGDGDGEVPHAAP